MLFINFAIIFFVLQLFFRSLSSFGQNFSLSPTVQVKIGILFSGGMILFSMIFFSRLIQFIILIICAILVLAALVVGKEKDLKKRILQHKLPFVRLVLVRIASGDSLARAAIYAYAQLDSKVIPAYKQIVNLSMTNTQDGVVLEGLSDLSNVLRICFESRKNVSTHLAALRHKLEVEDCFNKKVASVTAQAHMQTVILSLLYVCAMVYCVHQHGLFKNQVLLFLSSVWFSFGVFLIYFLTKRFKWMV